MRRFVVRAAAALLFGVVGIAHAQASDSTFTFTAVDAVRMAKYHGSYIDSPFLYVTGVLEGASQANEEAIDPVEFDVDECRRLAVIAMMKPGQYRLSFDGHRVTPSTGSSYVYAYDCKLQRVTP